jgi:carbon-monoxide dehydrogenase medium subunit
VIPGTFDYHRPKTLNEAVGLLNSLGEEARVVAGGHSLIPMMKLRMAQPDHLVDLQDLDELRGIEIEGESIVIGALTTQHEIAASDDLARVCPILRETSLLIADPQVRYCGTLGGNLANGDPGNDMPAVMMALNASYHLTSNEGTRQVAAREFYEAAFFTKLTEAEILARVEFPRPAPGTGFAYEKQKRKIGDYATAAAAVVLTMSGGSCTAAAIALTNLADTPLFAEAAGAALVGSSVDDDAVGRAAEAAKAIADPASDGRGPAEFRTHLAGVMVRRAVNRALAGTAAAA